MKNSAQYIAAILMDGVLIAGVLIGSSRENYGNRALQADSKPPLTGFVTQQAQPFNQVIQSPLAKLDTTDKSKQPLALDTSGTKCTVSKPSNHRQGSYAGRGDFQSPNLDGAQQQPQSRPVSKQTVGATRTEDTSAVNDGKTRRSRVGEESTRRGYPIANGTVTVMKQGKTNFSKVAQEVSI